MTNWRSHNGAKRAGFRATFSHKRRTASRSWLATWLQKLSPWSAILLLTMLATGALAQGPPVGSTPPPQAMAALSPGGIWTYLRLDPSGNLYTSGSPAMGPAVGATPSPVALVGFNPTTGRWEYLTLDASGNLNVTGGGGGGSMTYPSGTGIPEVTSGASWGSTYNASNPIPTNFLTLPSALPPNGSASGDLSGSYPSPTVAKINGTSFPTSAAVVGSDGSAKPVAATVHALSLIPQCISASGSGSAYTCSTSPTFVPAEGDYIWFKADLASTGTATLKVNGQAGTPNIHKVGGTVNIVANDLRALQWTLMLFDGSAWDMQGQLGNAPQAALGYTPEDVANKDTTTTLGTSDTKYPSQNAAKTYVDTSVSNAIAGVNPAVAVLLATTAAGDTSGLTYVSGVFTGSVNTPITIDGTVLTAVGQRVLVKNDTQSPSGAFNGVYSMTQVQTVALPPVLTRATDYNAPSDINSTGAIPVQSGTVNTTTSWLLTSQVVTVGTSPLTYVKFSLAPSTILYTTSAPTANGVLYGAGTQIPSVVTPPTVNGRYSVGYTVTGSVAVAPTAVLSTILIASGAQALGTPTVTTGTCSSAVTATATGTLTSDVIIATPAVDPTGVTGYAPSATGSLYIQAYPTTDTANFKVCNNTSGSLTPSAMTMNWRVVR